MKSVFAVIDSFEFGKKLVYCQEDTSKVEQIFNLIFSPKESEADSTSIKDNISKYLQQTQYFGLVLNSNFCGFSADFIINFFDEFKQQTSLNEIMIEDSIFLIQQLQLKESKLEALTVVFIVRRDSLQLDTLRFWHQFFVKYFSHLEEESSYLSQKCIKTIQLMLQFENKIKAHSNIQLSELKQLVKETSENQLQQSDLAKEFTQLLHALQNQKPVPLNKINLVLPSQDVLQNSHQEIKIKTYQSLVVSKGLTDQRSKRFQHFIKGLNPTKSFQDYSIAYNMPMSEIEIYVNYLLSTDAGRNCVLVNQLTPNTYIVINKLPNQAQCQRYQDQYETDLLDLLKNYDSPQLVMQSNKDEFKKICLCLLQKQLRVCNVYLYQNNPFLKPEDQDEIIKRVAQKNKERNDGKDISEGFRSLEQDRKCLQLISTYFGKPVPIEEICRQIKFEQRHIWSYIRDYEQIIGYYLM